MMLVVKFQVGEDLLNFSGTSKELETKLAKKLACNVDELIFERPNEEGKMEEWLMGDSAWKTLDGGKAVVQVRSARRRPAKKRKSGSGSTVENDSGVKMNTVDLTPTPSQGAAKKQKERRQSASRTTSGTMPKFKLDSNRKKWTDRDKDILWNKFVDIMKTLPQKAGSYEATQRDNVLKKLQENHLFAKRSMKALEGQIMERLRTALQLEENPRKQSMDQYLKLFPALRKAPHSHRRSSSTDEDSDTIDELSDSSSSESEYIPPPASVPKRNIQRGPAKINDHNPYVGILQPERGTNPSWSRRSRLDTNTNQTSPNTFVEEENGTCDTPMTDLNPKSPLTDSRNQANGASTGDILNKQSGKTHDDAIEIDSDDAEDNASTSALGFNSAAAIGIKQENGTMSNEMLQRLNKIYPFKYLQSIGAGPNFEWAVSMASWIKQDVLKFNSSAKEQMDKLAFCFTEFFYYSCILIDPTGKWSISRLTAQVVLIFLDLYEALWDLPYRQKALSKALYYATLAPTAREIDDGGKKRPEWNADDICAWAATLLPTGSSYLINDLFDECNNFSSEGISPTREAIDKMFKKMHPLLHKVIRTQDFIKRHEQEAPIFKVLADMVDGPYIARLNIPNLEALSSKSSLAREATECIAWLKQLNENGKLHKSERRAKEDQFTKKQLVLFSVYRSFETRDKMVTNMLKGALPGTSTIIGPFEKLLDNGNFQLWIMQLNSSSPEKRLVVEKLKTICRQDYIQVLEDCNQVHTRARNNADEQRNWHRVCCLYILHQDIHNRIMRRF